MADLQAQRRQAWLGGGGIREPTLLNGDQPDATRISTTGLAGILTRAYDDLYVTVAAGSSVAAVATGLATDGFILPLAAPWPDATIGTVAAQFNSTRLGAAPIVASAKRSCAPKSSYPMAGCYAWGGRW